MDPDVEVLLRWLANHDEAPAPRVTLAEHLRLGVKPLEHAIAAARAGGWIAYSSGGGSRGDSPIRLTQPGWLITESGRQLAGRNPGREVLDADRGAGQKRPRPRHSGARGR